MRTRSGASALTIGRLPRAAPVASTLAVIGALAILSIACVYGANVISGDLIRSDATGYYMYLPAILLDHDVTMEKTRERSFADNPTEMSGIRPVPPHNRLLDQFPIGEAVMIAPFFGVAHVVAIASGARRDGFSWPYQVATSAAGLSYALAGLALLASILGRWFSRRTVLVTLVAVTFGTDLFHYATINANFSHAFSFALVALVLVLTLSLREGQRPTTALALGATLGLLTLVRPTDLVVLVFCALVGVDSLSRARGRVRVIVRRLDLVALGSGVFLLVLIPQLAYWHAITGKVFVNPYESDARLELLHPHVLQVLFSVRKGLFFWTPLLLLAVAGLPALRRRLPALFVPTVLYLLVQTWVVSSWTYWWYGGSFGMRPFVESLPILALPFAALVEAATTRVARRVLVVAIALTTLLAVHAMLGYWTGHVPYDGTTWRQYLHSYRYL